MDQLKRVEQLSEGSKVTRFFNSPSKYIEAMYLRHVSYPKTHKGTLKKAPLFFGGEMEVLLPAATDVYLAGGKTHSSEIRLARFLIANLKEGGNFLDIGAHFGYFTLLAANIVGDKGTVNSIEPARETYNLLVKNTTSKKNVTTHHVAIADAASEVTFFEFPILYSEYNALSIEQFEHEDWIKTNPPTETKVKAVSIDSFLATSTHKPDIIKIDVEGAEVQAIKGAKTYLENNSPIIVLEYLLKDDSNYNDATLLLAGYGYKSCMIKRNGELEHTTDIEAYMNDNNMTSENVVFIKENK